MFVTPKWKVGESVRLCHFQVADRQIEKMHICTPVVLQICTLANQILYFSKSALLQICTFANLHVANLHLANLHVANLHLANLHLANLHLANLHFCKHALSKSETYTSATLHSCVSAFSV